MAPLIELERAYAAARRDRAFQSRLRELLRDYAGRPTPLYFAARLSEHCGGARIYLKREDLCHTGAHKINNVLGQALLAVRMKKRRLIAETGAGQHGVATATAARALRPRLRGLHGRRGRGAAGPERLPHAPARRAGHPRGERQPHAEGRHQRGPAGLGDERADHPLSARVRPRPAPVSDDGPRLPHRDRPGGARAGAPQIGRLPDVLVACVGGGSNAIGLFHPFIGDRARSASSAWSPAAIGISTGRHGATLTAGRVGVLHGTMSYFLQNDDGQIAVAHSISAGLDYPGVGPEHAYYKDTGRFEFVSVTDDEALEGFQALTRLEGLMPALESAHAVTHAMRLAKTLPRSRTIVVGLSGRGDKDVHVVAKALGTEIG